MISRIIKIRKGDGNGKEIGIVKRSDSDIYKYARARGRILYTQTHHIENIYHPHFQNEYRKSDERVKEKTKNHLAFCLFEIQQPQMAQNGDAIQM